MRSTFVSWLPALPALLYLLAALGSLLLIFVSGDSLAGVFAAMLIQPWAPVLAWLTAQTGLDSFLFNMVFMLGGAVCNAWLIWLLTSQVAKRLSRR